MRTIAFTAPKGGQGTTTVAAATAVFAAGHDNTTLVAPQVGTLARLLGTAPPSGEPVEIVPGLWLASQPVEASSFAVVDESDGTTWADADARYVVVRGPCYLALAALLEPPGLEPDGIVLVVEKGRSLTERDVVEVTGIPVVATVTASDAVARTIDAGLLLARLHRLPELSRLRSLVAPTEPAATLLCRTTAAPRRQPNRTPSSTGTDLPLPQSGRGGDWVRASETVRETGRSMHVYRVWNWPERRRAEHRQARAWRGRLLHRRGRHLRRGLLHRPR